MHKRYADLNKQQKVQATRTFIMGDVLTCYTYEIGITGDILSRRRYREINMEDPRAFGNATEGDIVNQFDVWYDIRQVRPATGTGNAEARDRLLLRSATSGEMYCVTRFFDGTHGPFNLARVFWPEQNDLDLAQARG